MAMACPNCHSSSTQALADRNQCIDCGTLFDFSGNVAATGLDQAGRDAHRAIADKVDEKFVVGNIADLQRLGGQLAAGSATAKSLAAAVPLPPDVDEGDVIHGDEVTVADKPKTAKK